VGDEDPVDVAVHGGNLAGEIRFAMVGKWNWRGGAYTEGFGGNELKRRYLLILELLLLAALGVWVVLSLTSDGGKPAGGLEFKLQLREARDRVVLYRDEQGQAKYIITQNDGKEVRLTPEELAGRLLEDRKARTWMEAVLNVSSAAGYFWVGLGLLGQVLFTGRMVVQWLVSEKNKKSTVPTVFWWMSLVGATMLLMYFMWRRDPIGLLGQAFGWFIYVRNLWMIYRAKEVQEAEVGDAEPVAAEVG
jgi:lipid-A-disaccharide synthase-like uncharacterized protein